MKLAVLFPGIGYTCDKPLLYYSGKLASKLGYEVVPVPYGNFKKKIKGDRNRMEESFQSALSQAEELLGDVKWESFEEIVFISKSIGTIVASFYARQHGLSVRSILFTPLSDTFEYAENPAAVFHGTSDPWADTAVITELCRKKNIPLYLTPGANHSLETGNIFEDIRNLEGVMKTVKGMLE